MSALAAALAAVALLGASPPAFARPLHTVVEDDNLALFSSQKLPRFLDTLRWLGVDQLRVSAEWRIEAPVPDSAVAPVGFPFSNPGAYDSPGMRLLDRAVRAATAAGLQVMIDPAFSAPRWATRLDGRAPPPSPGWYRTNINVPELVSWEVMLARRYSGQFTPPGSPGPLPRVRLFNLWNEPNGQSFLAPQWRGASAVSADWYRRLVDVAYPAIKRVAPWATILIGNTSDAGGGPQTGVGVPPLDFIRRMACVDAKLSPVHDGACAHFHAVPGDGYAHHPYERDAAPWIPSSGQSHAGWAQMGDLDRVQSLIDRLVEMHRLAPGVRELWLTEQGYESNAELNDRRWSEAQQAQLNAVSEYLAWRSPSVQSFSQFLLHDSRTRQTLALRRRSENPTATLSGTWTTGLERENGVPKPALWMFRSPVVARLLPARAADPADVPLSPEALRQPVSWIEVWGRARPVRAPTLVMVRVGGFTTRCTVTDSNGIFDIKAAVPYGTRPRVGFSWLAARGGWQASPTTVPIAFPLRQL